MPHTGICTGQTGGQEVDDSTVTNDVVREAREFAYRNRHAKGLVA